MIGPTYYRNWLYYELSEGNYLMNVPEKGDEVFKTIDELKKFVDEYIDGPDCKYCNGPFNDTLLEDEFDGNYTVIENRKLTLRDNDESYASIKINFCPMCGRKLTKE